MTGDNKKGCAEAPGNIRGMTIAMINDGKSCRFWDDLWSDEILSEKFSELYSFAKKKKINTAIGLTTTESQDLLHLPISQEAFSQMGQLQEIMVNVVISNDH